jgi:hypothetical protein
MVIEEVVGGRRACWELVKVAAAIRLSIRATGGRGLASFNFSKGHWSRSASLKPQRIKRSPQRPARPSASTAWSTATAWFWRAGGGRGQQPELIEQMHMARGMEWQRLLRPPSGGCCSTLGIGAYRYTYLASAACVRVDCFCLLTFLVTGSRPNTIADASAKQVLVQGTAIEMVYSYAGTDRLN